MRDPSAAAVAGGKGIGFVKTQMEITAGTAEILELVPHIFQQFIGIRV